MKKIFSILLATVCIFTSLFAATVTAASGPVIKLGSVSAKAGDEVTLDVSIQNNPGVAYLKLQINYGSELSITEAVNSGIIKGTFTKSKTTAVKPYVLQWMGAENSEGDGVIASITFKISEDAKAENLPVTVEVAECYNEAFDDVEFETINANIAIETTGDEPEINKDLQAEIESKTANQGETAVLKVKLKSGEGLTSMAASDITYDSAALTLKEVKWLPENANIIEWDAVLGNGVVGYEKAQSINADVLEITFSIANDAPEGDYEIGLKYRAIINEKLLDIPVTSGVLSVVHNHNYIDVAAEKYLKSAATCVSPAIYYKSCSICGEMSEETFLSGEALGHDWAAVWTSDGEAHWHICTRCDAIADKAAHTFGDWIETKPATVTEKGERKHICEICGYEEHEEFELGYIPGDVNNDGKVTDKDAIYLLFNSFFPDIYPVNQPCDFNSDGNTDSKDAVYLLFYVYFEKLYPIE